MATIIKNLGPVTAYKYAVQKGYTGTEEEFAELMASYADVAEEAAESAAAAAASATAASGSASTASTKASEAAGSASAAAGSASAAGTKASEAAGSATAAAGSASTASTKADEAAASATAAAGSATTAGTKASEAASSASAAASSKTAAQAAQTAAEAAQTAAETAQGEAEDAAASVSESAAQIATNTADISQLKSDITLIVSGTVNPNITWENGQIGSDGQDKAGNDNRRTHSYIDIGDYEFIANLTKPGPVSLTLYLCEYDAEKEYLGTSSRGTTGDLIPQNALCKFVRLFTYSATVAQADQESYVTLTITNPEAIHDITEAVAGKLDIQDYHSDIHAYDMLDSSVLFRSDSIEIGATKNNDSGDTTYIYKVVADTDNVGCVWLRVKSISNARSNSIYAYYYNSKTVHNSTTLISSTAISDELVKKGTMLIPPSGTLWIRVSFYPSTRGGLTDQYAVYEDCIVGVTPYKLYPMGLIQRNEKPVPYYYFQGDYINNKVVAIRNAIVAADGNFDVFAFCTDQHWRLNAQNSPALMKYIANELNIYKAFMGGDYADGINLDALCAYKQAFPGKIYNVVGNHEYMNYFEQDNVMATQTINEEEVWLYLNSGMTDAVIGNSNRQYYYIDNQMLKMRYIILSVYADNGESAVTDFGTAQQTWFRDVALNLPSGYTAVVFVHSMYNVYYNNDTITINQFAQPIADIVDAYNGAGEIACIIQGHTHVDGMTATTGGTPVFITTCDKYLPWIQNGVDMEPWLTDNRHLGTITEQAFDFVVVDKTNRKITLVRIGAPADNGTSAKLEIREQYY